jgi:hypothetical protein
MIATAAEANPSCFSPTPLVDVHQTLIPTYLRVVSRGTKLSTDTKTAELIPSIVEAPRSSLGKH